jgi:hypothetical protein
MENLLAKYEERAKTMADATLFYALRDVMDTLAVLHDVPMSDPYIQKLYAEFDAYSVEMYKRRHCK